MPQTDRTPLLEHNNDHYHKPSYKERIVGLFGLPGDQPGWFQSYEYFLFGSWLNILLVFIPLSFISHHLHWDVALRSSFSFIAIMPLAKLLGDATDQLSLKLSETLSGLLNASFGNAIEIIVGLAALLQDELRIVQTSLLGSILSNSLLVLGSSFLAGALKSPESDFQVTAAQNAASLMTLACITLVIPAAYFTTQNGGLDRSVLNTGQISAIEDRYQSGLLIISRGAAILLLFIYVAYIVFQVKTHGYLFRCHMRCEPGGICLVDGETTPPEGETLKMAPLAAGTALLLVTVVTSFIADYFVASIEETALRYNIPKPFIGLILLPFASNAAGHVTSVRMALKDKMELALGISVGSSIQVSTFVIPLLVVVGWATGHDLTLYFTNFETVVLFVSVLLVSLLIQDGKSNYLEGLMLVALYIVIALAFWVS